MSSSESPEKVPFGRSNGNKRKKRPKNPLTRTNDDHEPYEGREKAKQAVFGTKRASKISENSRSASKNVAVRNSKRDDGKPYWELQVDEDDDGTGEPKPQVYVLKNPAKKKRKRRGVVREVHLDQYIPPGYIGEDDDWSYDTDTPIAANGHPKPLRLVPKAKPSLKAAPVKSEKELEEEQRRRHRRWRKRMKTRNISVLVNAVDTDPSNDHTSTEDSDQAVNSSPVRTTGLVQLHHQSADYDLSSLLSDSNSAESHRGTVVSIFDGCKIRSASSLKSQRCLEEDCTDEDQAESKSVEVAKTVGSNMKKKSPSRESLGRFSGSGRAKIASAAVRKFYPDAQDTNYPSSDAESLSDENEKSADVGPLIKLKKSADVGALTKLKKIQQKKSLSRCSDGTFTREPSPSCQVGLNAEDAHNADSQPEEMEMLANDKSIMKTRMGQPTERPSRCKDSSHSQKPVPLRRFDPAAEASNDACGDAESQSNQMKISANVGSVMDRKKSQPMKRLSRCSDSAFAQKPSPRHGVHPNAERVNDTDSQSSAMKMPINEESTDETFQSMQWQYIPTESCAFSSIRFKGRRI